MMKSKSIVRIFNHKLLYRILLLAFKTCQKNLDDQNKTMNYCNLLVRNIFTNYDGFIGFAKKLQLVYSSFYKGLQLGSTRLVKFPSRLSSAQHGLQKFSSNSSLIKMFITRKKLLQHESITPIKSGITSSQILQIQN